MEERELTQLLQQLGDRVTPSPAPVRRIVDAGEALRGRRSGRVRMFAVAAAAAAVVVGGAVAATVIDLPSGNTMSADSGDAAGGVDDRGAGAESAPLPAPGTEGADQGGATAADAAAAPVLVTPDVAEPGESVQLTSRNAGASFGLAWALERLTGAGWTREYTLAAAFRDRAPEWWPEGEAWTVPEPMVDAPLTFVIPPDVPSGDYRICEQDAPEVCAYLTVTD